MLVTWKQLRDLTPALCLLAAGVLLGAWATRSGAGHADPQQPPLMLNASGASANDAFALAAGAVDEEAEGVFLLDFLTGDLQCLVMNPRTGTITARFMTNVIKVLGVDQQKKPRYVMVAGDVGFLRGAGINRPANTVCYVVDANTGAFAAFGFTWNRNAVQTGTMQQGALTVLAAGKARNVEITE